MKAKSLTDDAFLGGLVNLLQPKKGARAGIDAVFLAASIPASTGDQVLEAGFGSGAASLCLAARVEGLEITGVEISPQAIELGAENIARNGMEGNIRLIEADVAKKNAALIKPDYYDHVFANPPYHIEGRGRVPPDPGKATAHTLPSGGLQDWIAFLHRAVKPGGSITIVHRPESLGEILDCLNRRAGNIRIMPLFPKPGAPAHRIIIRAVKGNRAPLAILPGLVLQDENGKYCKQAETILRHGSAMLLDS